MRYLTAQEAFSILRENAGKEGVAAANGISYKNMEVAETEECDFKNLIESLRKENCIFKELLQHLFNLSSALKQVTPYPLSADGKELHKLPEGIVGNLWDEVSSLRSSNGELLVLIKHLRSIIGD